MAEFAASYSIYSIDAPHPGQSDSRPAFVVSKIGGGCALFLCLSQFAH
jgi:hypothetical protein